MPANTLRNWIKKLGENLQRNASRLTRRNRYGALTRHATMKPAFEFLEDRLTPSNIVTLATPDSATTQGTLRYAIANEGTLGSSITFAASLSGDTITLTSALTISANVAITGLGASNLAISGGGAVQDLNISSGVTATISGLTIEGGSVSGSGGGIANAGALTVSNCTINGDTASAKGGGIYNTSYLTLQNSTVSSNKCASGAGIYSTGSMSLSNDTISSNTSGTTIGTRYGGGIYVFGGTLTIQNCTVSGNSNIWGGGIANTYGTVITVSDCTISGNSAHYGGGIYTYEATDTLNFDTIAYNSGSSNCGGLYAAYGMGPLTVTLANSIVSNNTGSSDATGTITLANSSLIDNTSGLTINGSTSTDIFGVSAGLATTTAANNGGPTQTIALTPTTSPAIGEGLASTTPTITTDQRGISLASPPDMGAFQLETVTPSTASLPNTSTSITIYGSAFDPTAANDTVTFSNGVSGTVSFATSTSLTVSLTGLSNVTGGTALNTTVTVDGVSSGGAVQVATVTAPSPTVTASTVGLADSSTTITINGSNFSTTAASDSVTFNLGVVGSVTSATASQLTVALSTPPTALSSLTAVVSVSGTSSGSAVPVATEVNGTWTVASGLGTLVGGTLSAPTLLYADYYYLGGDSINFASSLSGHTIILAYNLTLPSNVTITGLGASNLAISGGGAVQDLNISSGVTATISGLTIEGGSVSGSGGGIANAGTLTVSNCTINGDTASAKGGGIYNTSYLTLQNSTVSSNKCVSGSGIYSTGSMSLSNDTISSNTSGTTIGTRYGGGIYVFGGTLTIQNCTVSGNSNIWGGGIANTYGTVITVSDCTISGNSAHYGGGIYTYEATDTLNFDTIAYNSGSSNCGGLYAAYGMGPLTVTLANSIVSNNTGSSDATGTITLANSSLIDNTSGLTINGSTSTDIFGVSAGLATTTAANNGGPTQTIALTPTTSPAIGEGLASTTPTITTDQRGISLASPPDMGAFQLETVTASTASLPNTSTSITIYGSAFDPTAANDTVTFSNGVSGTVSVATSTTLTVSLTGLSSVTGGTALNATVTVDGVSSGSAVQVATVTPVLTASTANLANNATTITIAGTGFSTMTASDAVSFNLGAVGSVTAASATSLTVTFSTDPTSTGSLTAAATIGGVGVSSAAQVATVTAPTVTTNTASLPSNATTITIAGTGFSTTTANDTVSFNLGAVGSVTAATTTTLTVIFSTDPTSTGSLTATATVSGVGVSSATQVATVVAPATTTTSLADNGPSPSVVAVPVSYTVTTSAVPNGSTVELEDASNSNAIVGSVVISGNTGSTTVSSLAVGMHEIFAVYTGAVGYASSQSSQVAQMVTVAAASWDQFNGNPQHTGISAVAAQPTDQILWSTPIDLYGSTYGSAPFWHTGEPVFTPNDTVIVPVMVTKSGNTAGVINYELEAFNGNTGALIWTADSYYIAATDDGSWTPPYQPVYDAVNNRVYFAGPGGTLYYISNPDSPGSSTPTPVQVAFYGTSNYTANESAYNSSLYVDTPLTVDNSGNVFFGFAETGSNPSGITDGGIARISAAGAGTYVTTGSAVGVGSGEAAYGSAPALSNDGSVLYVAMDDSYGAYLVGVNAATLTPEYSVQLSVPNSDTSVYLEPSSTAAPMVAPDGTVFMGVFSDNYDGSRGFMTHYSANLQTEYTPGAFGWDDTASIIPTSMVPSYTGTSSYLILTKFNNYVAGETGSTGGNGVNEIAILDPYATETDPNNDPNPDMLVMKQVMTITSPTEDSGWVNDGYPDATREWCTNGTAVDPATDSVFINNEDGYSYRWNLATDTITQAVEITNGYGEPYTPTTIGPNGVVYVLNGGTLFALGGYTNYTLTNVSSQTPSVVGQSVTFTTTLASTNGGPVPTGSITYSYTSGVNTPQNSTPVTLGTESLVNGQATFTTSALIADHYHITASYSGDMTDGYTAGSTTLVQVELATPTTTLSSSASAVASAGSVTFTATVSPPAGVSFVPLGTVAFMYGNTLLGTEPLNSLDQSTASGSSQVVTFTTSSLPQGSDAITAVYSGDLNFNGDTSSALTQIVGPPIVTAPNISISGATGTGGAYRIGDTVTATWNNSGTGDNNTGISGVTVNFSQFGGGTAVSASNNGSGTWTATYTIVSGAINDGTNRNVSVTATNAVGGTTTAGTNNATVDDQAPLVTLNSVTSPTTNTTPTFSGAAGTASGDLNAITVDVYSGASATGSPVEILTTTASGGSYSVAATAALSLGTYTAQASQSDAAGNTGTSTSSTFTVQSSITNTSTNLTDNGPSPSTTGQAVSYTVNTTGVPNGATVYLDDANQEDAQVGSVVITSGTGSTTISSLSVGTHGIFASYAGDETHSSSSSGQIAQVVNSVTTTTTSLTDNGPSPSIVGTGVSYTVSTTGVPNGSTVYLEDADHSNAVVGSVVVSGGTGSTTVSNLSIGSHSIFAVYTGAAGYTASQSTPALAQTVSPIAVTSVAVNGDFIAISDLSEAGQTVTVTSDGINGFTAGNQVVIAGETGTAAGYNGTWTILSASGDTFTYTNSATGLPTLTFNANGYAISTNTSSSLRGSQRSMVDSVVYTFNAPVNLTSNAVTMALKGGITVTGPNTMATGVANVNWTSLSGGKIWVMTFSSASGNTVTGHSIADGVYTLSLNSADVTAVAGGSTMTTTRATDTFYRLYADTNGQQRVSNADLLAFNNCYAQEAPSASYLAALDYNADGRVNNTDLLAFNNHYSAHWTGFTSTI